VALAVKAPEPVRFAPASVATDPARSNFPELAPNTAAQHIPEVPAPVTQRRVATAASENAPRERMVIATPDARATLHPDAITTPYKAIVAASIKATLPPAPVTTSKALIARPDVKATLPPVPGATSNHAIVSPDVNATLPPVPVATPITPVVTADEAPAPRSAASTADVSASSEIPPPDLPDPTPVPIPTTIRLRGTRLRARRLGQAVPPLDERIEKSRSRKIRGRLKTRRKPKPLLKAPCKAPARRIAAAANVSNTFISTKAATKIVGAPPKPLRVRLATTP